MTRRITIEFSDTVTFPESRFDENLIVIPSFETPGVTLAWIIHELCHYLFTTYDLGQVVHPKEIGRFHLLNTLEDVRVNRRCFDLLPGIKPLFEEFYTYLSLKPLRRNYGGVDKLQRGLEGFAKEPSKELVFLSELAIGYLDLLSNTTDTQKGEAYVKNVRSLIAQIENKLRSS